MAAGKLSWGARGVAEDYTLVLLAFVVFGNDFGSWMTIEVPQSPLSIGMMDRTSS